MNETIDLKRPAARPIWSNADEHERLPAPLQREGVGTSLAHHAEQLRRAARRRLPRAIFDYIEGGAYEEITLRANRADLQALRLRQRVLAGVVSRRQSTTIVGQRTSLPVALGPTGFAGLIRPNGEFAAARAAEACGVPYCLSTFSTRSIEELAEAVQTPFFFQLYLFKDRAVNQALLQRAEAAGCPALVLTLDAPLQGRRHRDLDHGLVVPLKVRMRLALQMATKLRWAIGWLTSEHRMGNLAMFMPGQRGELAEASLWAERNFKGALLPGDVAWVRDHWPGKLILKGILDPADARMALELGADAILVSNHGGRQLDGALSAVKAFPAIRDEVGDGAELLFDGGIRSGLDVLKALGLGAKACFLGRAYLYGLAGYGQAGVETALRLIAEELDVAMALTGVSTVTDLSSGLTIRSGG